MGNREKIENAKITLNKDLSTFSIGLVNTDLNYSINSLIKTADNEYKKFVVGGVLYEIDSTISLMLHEEAYKANPTDENFVLEYAMELHRAQKFNEAAKLYEVYNKNHPEDYRINIWLSDCYINIGEIEKSISQWFSARHNEHHTSIDKAIYNIYGNTDQLKKRNYLRNNILKGEFKDFYPLIFLDNNWKFDWWNTASQDYFVTEDIKLAKEKLGKENTDYKILNAYVLIKKLEKEYKIDEIKSLLIENKLILNNEPLPIFGEIASDLLRICLMSGLISEKEIYQKRGKEILDFALKSKDKDLLNIYAYLQANVEKKVKPEIDKLGWKEFKDIRFAISYMIGKKEEINSSNTELLEAMLDFPNSSNIYWYYAKALKTEGKPVKHVLIELIKKEFKTLESDESHYSYKLNSFFHTLSEEK
jgi:hypothetical protein